MRISDEGSRARAHTRPHTDTHRGVCAPSGKMAGVIRHDRRCLGTLKNGGGLDDAEDGPGGRERFCSARGRGGAIGMCLFANANDRRGACQCVCASWDTAAACGERRRNSVRACASE
jgi:hypothetical protein